VNNFKMAICFTLVTVVAVGCSSKPENAASDASKPVPTIKVALSTKSLPYVEASPKINEDKYVKKLRELSGTNVQFELIPHQDFEQKLGLILASGELSDLLEIRGINTPVASPAVSNGAFLELNDLIDKYAPNLKNKISKEVWNSPTLSKDGKIYAIPNLTEVTHSQAVYVRKDWLDKLGLKAPKTIDEYTTVLRAFRDNDPNGNGKADEIPFSGRKNFRFAELFFGAYDVSPGDDLKQGAWKYVNNQLVPNYVRPEMKEALAVYKKLYQEKLIDNEIFVQEGKDWDAKIKGAARVGMWMHDPSYPDKWLSEVRQGDPKAEILIIPAPIGPDGKGGTSIISSIGSAFAIPKSSKNAEAVLKFLDWFYTDQAEQFMTYGLEGEDYTMNNGKIEYKYPTTPDGINKENMHLKFMRITGPSYVDNKAFMKGRNEGGLITAAMDVANAEGRKNDGIDMPLPAAMQSHPELAKNGLWMETAAKIIIGTESIDYFDKFVEDWKKRGGDQIIQEATKWYDTNVKK
jgi:putative aldouronate transport system substrate-binding protein